MNLLQKMTKDEQTAKHITIIQKQ